MNQFNQLCKYLDKLGIPYEKYTFNTDRVFKGLTGVSVPYKDDNGYEARIQADKSITVRKETHGIKDYVVANLYYIEFEDGFVDPNDCSPKKELFVMDAWEAARYIGAEYFGKDPEDIEPMLESKSNKKCSMQKKMESLGKKNERSVRHFTNRIESLAEQEFVDMAAIGEYLLRAFSEDDIEKLYGWLEQDEMIPSEEELRDEYEVEFDYDGDLVGVENESKKTEKAISNVVEVPFAQDSYKGGVVKFWFTDDKFPSISGIGDEDAPSLRELIGNIVGNRNYVCTIEPVNIRRDIYNVRNAVTKAAKMAMANIKNEGFNIEYVDKRSPAYFHDITRPVWQYFRDNKDIGIISGWHGEMLDVFDKDVYENDGPWFARLSYDSDTDKVQVEFFDGSKKEYASESVTTDELTGVLEDFLLTHAKEYLEYAGA